MANLEKPITTQEELDAVIKDRITRAEAKVEAKYKEQYKDYDTIKADYARIKGEHDTISTAHAKEVADLNNKINALTIDKLRADKAREYGIPYDFQDRLKGTTAEEIEADAKALAPMFAKGAFQNQQSPAFRANDPKPGGKDDAVDQALRTWISDNLKKE